MAATYFFCIGLYVFVLFIFVKSQLTRSRCPYIDIERKPGDVSRIALIEGVPVQEACLIRCDQTQNCESFVYEETKKRCALYNTNVATSTLTTGQQAVVKQRNKCIRSKFIIFQISNLYFLEHNML